MKKTTNHNDVDVFISRQAHHYRAILRVIQNLHPDRCSSLLIPVIQLVSFVCCHNVFLSLLLNLMFCTQVAEHFPTNLNPQLQLLI